MTVINKRLFPMRIEELPVIGGFVYNSFVRDVAGFAPFTDFNAPYPANYRTEMNLVSAAVSPTVIISQLVVVTFRLLTDMYAFRDGINKAEIYFNTAGVLLNVKPKDMGQRAVRTAINRGDVEQLMGKVKTLNQNIANNSAVLIAKGFTLAMQTALVTAAATLKTDNDTQNTLYELRSSTTSANMIMFNFFWTTYLSPTSKSGKLIYKVSDKTKAKDYTISLLVKRIRNDELQTEVHGKVTDAAGVAQNKAKVKLIPVDGGRTKTVYTNADGNYSMNGMRATEYNQVVTKGALVKITALTVITREHLELNVVVA